MSRAAVGGLNVVCVDVKDLLRLARAQAHGERDASSSQQRPLPRQASQKMEEATGEHADVTFGEGAVDAGRGYMIRGDPRYTSSLIPPVSPADPKVLEEVLRHPERTLNAVPAATTSTHGGPSRTPLSSGKAPTAYPASTDDAHETSDGASEDSTESSLPSVLKRTSSYRHQHSVSGERFTMAPRKPPAHLASKRKPVTDPTRRNHDQPPLMSYDEFVASRKSTQATASSPNQHGVPGTAPLGKKEEEASRPVTQAGQAARAPSPFVTKAKDAAQEHQQGQGNRSHSSYSYATGSEAAAPHVLESSPPPWNLCGASEDGLGLARDGDGFRFPTTPSIMDSNRLTPPQPSTDAAAPISPEPPAPAPWSGAAMKGTFQSRQVTAARSAALKRTLGRKPVLTANALSPGTSVTSSVAGTPLGMPSAGARWGAPPGLRSDPTFQAAEQRHHWRLVNAAVLDGVRAEEEAYVLGKVRHRTLDLRSCPSAMRQAEQLARAPPGSAAATLSPARRLKPSARGVDSATAAVSVRERACGAVTREEHAARMRRMMMMGGGGRGQALVTCAAGDQAADDDAHPPIIPGPFRRNVANPPTRRPKIR